MRYNVVELWGDSMKKMIIILSVALLLCSCSGNNDVATDVIYAFSSCAEVDALNGQWLFVPAEAVNIKTVVDNDKLQLSFNGCEGSAVDAYVQKLYSALKDMGCAVYDAGDLSFSECEFIAKELNTDYAGTAYAYYYPLDGAVYSVKIDYYGCGGGKHGNGLVRVTITDETDYMNFLLDKQG